MTRPQGANCPNQTLLQKLMLTLVALYWHQHGYSLPPELKKLTLSECEGWCVRLDSAPHPHMSTENPRMWPYLEKGSFQIYLVKMRLDWISAGLDSNDWYPYKRKGCREKASCNKRSDTATRQGTARAIGNHQNIELLEPSEGVDPLILDVWPPELWE